MGKSKKEKKKEIKKFSDWLEGRAFRVDADRRNFEDHSGLRQYFMTQTGQSGPVEDLLATAKELKINNVGFDSEGDIFV